MSILRIIFDQENKKYRVAGLGSEAPDFKKRLEDVEKLVRKFIFKVCFYEKIEFIEFPIFLFFRIFPTPRRSFERTPIRLAKPMQS